MMEHQLTPDGLSCTCRESFYSIPAPYKETLWLQATHQLEQIGHYYE